MTEIGWNKTIESKCGAQVAIFLSEQVGIKLSSQNEAHKFLRHMKKP